MYMARNFLRSRPMNIRDRSYPGYTPRNETMNGIASRKPADGGNRYNLST
jgi:hypothetical protein